MATVNLALVLVLGGVRQSAAYTPISKEAAFANMFDTDPLSLSSMAKVETWLDAQPVSKPKACHLLLMIPLNMGPICKRQSGTKFCTQQNSMVRALKAIKDNFRKGDPTREYPIVILHNDATALQQHDIEARSGVSENGTPVMWYKINFDNGTLPTYLEGSNIRDYYLKYHRDPIKYPAKQFPGVVIEDLTLAHPRSHGWGYANMCRLFGGLVMFARPLQKFKYYWRIDGGDSALNAVSTDPFTYMQERKLGYGYGPLYSTEPGCPWNNFKLAERHVHFLSDAKKQGAPAEILDLRVHCDRMRQHAYNNFEVVNMDFFRTDAFWTYFSEFDRTAGFFCGYDKGDPSDCKMDGFEILSNGFRLTGTRVLGDAEFRGQAMAIFGGKPGGENGAAKLPGISYQHPVKWEC